MKILITGGAGFIGSNFIRYILNKYPDYTVVNLDKLTYCGNPDNLKDVANSSRYKFIQGDICDRKAVAEAMRDCGIIVNFSAETHVDHSIAEASEFIHTNVYGTYVLLEATKKSNLNRFVQISCYDEKTRALTTEGLKTYKELKKGDMIFSLNPRTLEIEIKPIEKVIIQYYKGKMIHFNNQRVDLLVTPNHNMFILNTTKQKLLVEEAEKACQRSIFWMPEGHWVGKEEEHFDITGYGKVKIEDLMYILGTFIGDGFTAYQEKEVETKTGLTRKEFLKKSRDIKNGKFKKIDKQGNHKSICHSYRIFFDIPKHDKSRKKVEKTFHNLGIKYHSHEGKAGTHLYFTSKVFTELFNQCGKGAYNKHIPRWVLGYSPKYLRFLLEGLMDSDGGHSGKIYFTVSEKLVSDICELCIKLNLKPSIHKKHSISFIDGRKIEGKSYYVCVANCSRSIYRHRNKLIDYDGHIWCLKVKDNKNFLVERNGKFNFCGNTDEVYGSRDKGFFKESDPLNPSSPYSATKAGADELVRSYFVTYKLPVVIVRPTNNFGRNQYPEKVIPLFITNILQGKKVGVYGKGENIRDWLYVADTCRAIDLLIHQGKAGEIYNVAGKNELHNIDLTRLILKIMQQPQDLIKFVEDRPGHDRRYALDCRKINKLGWRAQDDFMQALNETIKWYRDNRQWWEPLIGRRT